MLQNTLHKLHYLQQDQQLILMEKHPEHQIWQHNWQLHPYNQRKKDRWVDIDVKNNSWRNQCVTTCNWNCLGIQIELEDEIKRASTSTNMSSHQCGGNFPTVLTQWSHWYKKISHHSSNCCSNYKKKRTTEKLVKMTLCGVSETKKNLMSELTYGYKPMSFIGHQSNSNIQNITTSNWSAIAI